MITYTGNKGATQAPASTPAAGVSPILSLPVDLADPDTVATLLQAFKALADYANFEQGPTANPGAYAQQIRRFFDARGNARWEIDHWGMPRRAMIAWEEDFTPASAFNVTGTGNVRTSLPIIGGSGSYAVGRQRIVTFGAGCLTSSASPGTTYSNPPFPAALAGTLAPNATRQFAVSIDGGAAGNSAEIRLDDDSATATFASDAVISCEWEFWNFTNDAVLWVVGFCGSGEFVNTIANGLCFIRPNTAGVTWKARSIQHGTQTEVDTGVLAGTGTHVFRIDFSNGDSGAAPVALFWIDGNLVATITTNLPTGYGSLAIPTAGGVVQASGGGPYPTIYLLNAIRYRQITKLSLA